MYFLNMDNWPDPRLGWTQEIQIVYEDAYIPHSKARDNGLSSTKLCPILINLGPYISFTTALLGLVDDSQNIVLSVRNESF